MRVAESILFAGKAVRVLRNPSSSFRLQESFIHQPILRVSQKGQGFCGGLTPQKELLKEMNLIAEELLPQSEANKIEIMLQELKVFYIFLKCFSVRSVFNISYVYNRYNFRHVC